jgi:CAAX prenyl protease-like protein
MTILPDNDVSPRYRMLAYVLPILIFGLVGALEPTPRASTNAAVDSTAASEAGDASDAPAATNGWWPLPAAAYPWVFGAKIVATSLCVAWFWNFYRRRFPLRASWLAVAVGVVGFALWVGLWKLQAEAQLVDWLGGPDSTAAQWLGLGERAAYNPLAGADTAPLAAWGFLAIRFFGLVLLVPLIEELFLRAFFMRYIMHDTWWQIPFGEVNRLAVIAGIALPVLYHPEKLSALVWFSLVTWLMVRTKNFWDCVVAHAVTNLLLGIYVVWFNEWELW